CTDRTRLHDRPRPEGRRPRDRLRRGRYGARRIPQARSQGPQEDDASRRHRRRPKCVRGTRGCESGLRVSRDREGPVLNSTRVQVSCTSFPVRWDSLAAIATRSVSTASSPETRGGRFSRIALRKSSSSRRRGSSFRTWIFCWWCSSGIWYRLNGSRGPRVLELTVTDCSV